jgi:hypothetical protein
MKYYILFVEGGTEPETIGPFDGPIEQLKAAQERWKQADPSCDSIFSLCVENDVPYCFAFSNSDMDFDTDKLTQWIIQSKVHMEDFWCNENGWTDQSEATRFTDEEMKTLNLPMDGKWVFMS